MVDAHGFSREVTSLDSLQHELSSNLATFHGVVNALTCIRTY